MSLSNGKHEVRLDNIEETVRDNNEKLDKLLGQSATNKTDIEWLKWQIRSALVLGGGAVITQFVQIFIS